MNTAMSLYDHSNKGTPDYIESHKRSVFDIVASDMYYLLREVHLPCAVTILSERDHDVFSLLQTDADKAKRLAEAVYLSRQEVSLVAALSLANDNEHVDTGGRASEALNSHEC